MRFAVCRLSGRTRPRRRARAAGGALPGGDGEALPPIRISKTGCPYFPGSPYCFSIAHTARHAACVLAKRPVGLDAEELDRRVSPKLARRVLSETEYAQYLLAGDKTKALLTFWVLKEAQVKLTGQGLRGFPNDTHFSLEDPRVWDGTGACWG